MDIFCKACSWSEHCDFEAIVGWMKRAKMVRGNRYPDEEMIPDLLPIALAKLQCPECKTLGLAARYAAEDKLDDDAWDLAVTCKSCGQPIPPERLEALPETRLCVRCQAADESGEPEGEDAWCPRCGEPMHWRVPRTGGAHARLLCRKFPACRGEIT
jgi:ssDNA-binding Zn-finger/Zn-ribbon topoisomerase 1